MPLALAVADSSDAARIAEIHMAVFGSNAMLLAQFPTPAVRNELKKAIALKALADIDDPKTTVLVVRDSDRRVLDNRTEAGKNEQTREQRGTEDTVAFAKWTHPVRIGEHYTEHPWIWPPGTNFELVEDWAKKTEESQLRAVGDAPCYRLTFIGTDPLWQKRGAATMMVQWGMNQSRKDHVPAYLESTLEAAPFYRKLAFTAVEKFSLEYKVSYSEVTDVYEEISFVYNNSNI